VYMIEKEWVAARKKIARRESEGQLPYQREKQEKGAMIQRDTNQEARNNYRRMR